MMMRANSRESNSDADRERSTEDQLTWKIRAEVAPR